MDPGADGAADAAPPRVTVVVLNYNYARFAEACLDSVRAQTYPHIDLVVIDDGSTDGSRELLGDWVARNWPDATLALSEENRGIQARCAQALELATGKYFQIFSTDDQMIPEKIATQVAVMEADPEVALCYSDMYLVDDDGVDLGEMSLDASRAAGQPPRSGWVLDRVLARAGFCTASWLLRRDAVVAVGGYEPRIYTEDTPLLTKLAARYQCAYSEVPLVHYRWHRTNLSKRFASTPEHRIAWCELLESIDVPEYARRQWIATFRTRVRMLLLGNPRRDCVPHARRLLRADRSATGAALWLAAECGICDARARWLVALRDRVRAAVQRGRSRG